MVEQGENYSLDLLMHENVTHLQYTIVTDPKKIKSSPFNLMHSMACSHSLYLEALLHKAQSLTNDHLFLLNPLVQFSVFPWTSCLSWLQKISKEQPTLLLAKNNIPLGILIPREEIKTILTKPVLRFLTLTDAFLDLKLLQSVSEKFNHTVMDEEILLTCHKHLNVTPHSFLPKCQALHYLQACQKGIHSQTPDEMIAIMPYHAGDVLFFCLAMNETSHHFTYVGVNKAYYEIAKKILKNVRILCFEKDPAHRGGNSDSSKIEHHNEDLLYFDQYLYPLIPKNWAFYYFRPWRPHDSSKFHFKDQWKAALSHESIDLIPNEQVFPLTLSTREKRILIHFGGGWGLKIYPKSFQKSLCHLLMDNDYKITLLLDKPQETWGCQSHLFSSLEHLESLIKAHDLLVGMDSFPGHFSANYLNHPTLMLFASTCADNASSFHSPFYQQIHHGFNCSPCGEPDYCRRFLTTTCANFSLPQEVFQTIQKMYL